MSTVRFLICPHAIDLRVNGLVHVLPAGSLSATHPDAELDPPNALQMHDFHVCDLQALYPDVVDLLDRRPLGVFHRQAARTLTLEPTMLDVARALESIERMSMLRFLYVYCLCRDQRYFSALLRQCIAGSHSLFDFVEANFHKPWPVSRLADEFGMPLRKFRYLIRQYSPSLAALPHCGAACGWALTVRLLCWLMAVLVAAYVVFAGADFAFQKYHLHKQLMMSFDETRREHKEVEGNPEIKGRRREIHRETIESGSLAGKVRASTVVVRNPTRLAICLRYAPDEMPVPCVIAKGRHARARAIVALAERAGVPVVEHIPVARRLMDDVGIDEPIPNDLFEAVAAILRLALDLPYETEDIDDVDDAGAPDPGKAAPGI